MPFVTNCGFIEGSSSTACLHTPQWSYSDLKKLYIAQKIQLNANGKLFPDRYMETYNWEANGVYMSMIKGTQRRQRRMTLEKVDITHSNEKKCMRHSRAGCSEGGAMGAGYLVQMPVQGLLPVQGSLPNSKCGASTQSGGRPTPFSILFLNFSQ